MSNLTIIEKTKFEKLFTMGSGNVLQFSHRTLSDFVVDSTGIALSEIAGSKPNKLRLFWREQPNEVVGKLTQDMLSYAVEIGWLEKDGLFDECSRIAQRLYNESVHEPSAEMPKVPLKAVEDKNTSHDVSVQQSDSSPTVTTSHNMQTGVSIFCAYSHKDEEIRKQIEGALAVPRRQQKIKLWNDRKLAAGENIHQEIDRQLTSADFVLLLISPDFMNSDYCYEKEMKTAVERHEKGKAVVIPIIVRDTFDWQSTPIGSLSALPLDGRPIIGRSLRDRVLSSVARGISDAIDKFLLARSA